MSEKLKLEGVLSKGYGVIPKLVMKDTELTIEAKSIYAYLCSYAGGGDTAFPSVSLICTDLDISENRYLKHRKQLVDKGYITITRERKESGWSNNIYTIAHTVYLQNVGIRNVGIQSLCIQNEGTNKNSSNNNSINNNKPNKESKRPTPKHQYGEFKNVLLTDDEHEKLTSRFPDDLEIRIERLSGYVASTGKSYKSHYATIISWSKKDKVNAGDKKGDSYGGINF